MAVARHAWFFAPVLAAFAFACAPSPIPVPADDEDRDRDDTEESDVRSASGKDAGTTPAQSSSSTTTPPAPTHAPAADAGASAPSGSSCAQLSACCGSLQDTYDRFACMAVAIANDPSICQPAFVVCQGGGVGIGGIFDDMGSGGSP